MTRAQPGCDSAPDARSQEWLEQNIDSGACGKVSEEAKTRILGAVRENEIDREVLATLVEADLIQTLGITVLGQRCVAPARAHASQVLLTADTDCVKVWWQAQDHAAHQGASGCGHHSCRCGAGLRGFDAGPPEHHARAPFGHADPI